MLKKILAFALALLIVASMAACKKDPEDEQNPDDQPGQQTDTTDPDGTTDPITDPEPEPEPEPEPQPVDPEAAMEVVNEEVYATVTVDLRSTPAIEDNVVDVLRYGQRATRIKKGETWSKIMYQGTEYFVASNCLALYDSTVVLPGDKTEDNEGGTTVAPDTSDFVKLESPETVYVVVDTALNLRAEPHINGEVKMRVGFGTKMERVALNNSWSEVSYNGQTYYAYSEFLTNEQITDEGYTPLAAPQTMYVTAQSMWVRYYPSMLEAAKVPYTVMDGLHYGDAVQVIAISPDNSWAKVIIMGNEYYVGYQHLSTAAPAGGGEIVEPEIPGGK